MVDDRIIDYVRQCRQKGMSDEQIKQNLVASGWSESDIGDILGSAPEAAHDETPRLERRDAPEIKFSKMYIIPAVMLVIFVIAAVTIKPGAPKKCTEDWTCTDWSECVNGLQERTCIDQNNCNRFLYKPSESQSCNVASIQSGNITNQTVL